MNVNRVIQCVSACALAAAAQVTLAQTSELFLTDWDSPTCYVVQNGQVVRTFSRLNAQDGPGLVVQDTIKMIGQDPGGIGYEYDLQGNRLSGQYSNPSYDSLYDGATDGVHNWTIAHNDFDTNFALLQADADWNNLQILFVPARRSSGITYDANNGTLWITNNVGGSDRVQQFDFAGNLISEFPAIHSGGGYGIAWDPADDTLWLTGAFGTAKQLFQYNKSGTLLQTLNVSALPDTILGAEFQMGGGDVFAIEQDGDCPGTLRINASNAEPGHRIYFIYGFNEGQGPSVPGCTGLRVGILSPKVAGSVIADANGNASVQGRVPANACGRLKVQAVDQQGCELSNVLTIN